MDPVTHALASLTVGRAGAGKLSRLATPMLLVAGTIADLDWASAAGGPEKFLLWRRAATHSLIGTIAIAAFVAAIFSVLARGKSGVAAVKFGRAFAVCMIAAAAHVFLDLMNSSGVELFWPFFRKTIRSGFTGASRCLAADSVCAVARSACNFSPCYIGNWREGKNWNIPRAVAALILTVLYVCARWELHARSVMLMQDQLFHGETPALIRAYPEGANPFIWVGVVTTTDTLQEARVPVMLGRPFSSERAVIFHKPSDSLALRNAQSTDSAVRFLRFAQFPRATVIPTEDGFRVEICDLRFDRNLSGEGGIFVSIELDKEARVTKEEFRWGEPLER